MQKSNNATTILMVLILVVIVAAVAYTIGNSNSGSTMANTVNDSGTSLVTNDGNQSNYTRPQSLVTPTPEPTQYNTNNYSSYSGGSSASGLYTDDEDEEDDYDDYDDDDDYYEEDEDEDYEDEYILPESDTKKLTKSDLKGLSKDELRLARNEIYARHGRKFQDEELQDYFDSQSWYVGTIEPEDFVDSEELSKLEIRNAKFILQFG